MPSQNRRAVLIVEDDEYKLDALREFVEKSFPEYSVVESQALTSAIAALEKDYIWFAIVDMSLPTYDASTNLVDAESGQTFGGEDILRFIKSQRRRTFSVVVTQYPEFEDLGTGRTESVGDLERGLRNTLGDRFLGVIHYSGQYGEWRKALTAAFEHARSLE